MDNFELRRRALFKNVSVAKLIVTGANGIVNFVTNLIHSVKVVCDFAPIQEGTGDPSPDNVRPISGWTECNVYQRGANFIIPDNPSTPAANYSHTSTGTIKYSSEYGAFYSDGAGIGYAKHSGTSQRFFIAPQNMTVTFSVDVYLTDSTYGIRFYKNNNRITDIRGTANQWYHYTYTTTMDKGDYFNLAIYGGIYWKNLQVVNGSDDLPYSVYQGNTFPVSWQTEAGTVYGGTLTINEDGTGILEKRDALVDLSTAGWTIEDSTYGVFRVSISAMISTNTYSRMINFICNSYKTIRNNVWTTTTNWSAAADKTIAKRSTYSQIYLKNTSFAGYTVAQVQAALSGVYLVYPRNTVQTYNLTAEEVGQILSVIGTNNIWHNMNGAITVEYYNKQ